MRRLLRSGVVGLIPIMGVLGIVLALRQWDSFLHTFLHFFTLQGAVSFAITLTCVKVAHELGHAYTAKHYGCRVPTMGVALLVMWPVLYTDVSDAWRLVSARKRLLIGASGMLTELAIAKIATLLWSFLPDGPARSAAFLVATSTWVSTLLINASPFMRFDGYYLLSDWLGVSNLQDRSFALARWQLRRWLFALAEPPPENFPRQTRRTLIAYAWATWAYRAVVFFGIGLLVFHVFFKVLGIVLLAVEVGWFLVMPLCSELRQWWLRRRHIRPSLNLAVTLTVLAGGLWLLVSPWRAWVELPAELRAADYATLFAPVPSQIVEMRAANGQSVAAGDVLYRLEAPLLEQKLREVRVRLALTELTIQRQASSPEVLGALPVLQEQMAQLTSAERGLGAQLSRLTLSAPLAGTLVDLPPEIRPGLWVKTDQPLGLVTSGTGSELRGYLNGRDLDRIRPGATGRFLPEDPSRPGWKPRP